MPPATQFAVDPPTSTDRDIGSIMARLADGDPTAVLAMVDEHGHRLRGALRHHLRGLGIEHARAEDLDAMVLDAGFVLAECARGWRPGGAAPWVWASARIRGVVLDWLGGFAAPLDPERHDEAGGAPAVPDGRSAREVLDDLGRQDPRVAVLARALDRVASPRDAELFVELLLQRGGRDAAPAATVAERAGLQPAAVRQVAHRVRRRLAALAADDPAFRSLAELPLLAGGVGRTTGRG